METHRTVSTRCIIHRHQTSDSSFPAPSPSTSCRGCWSLHRLQLRTLCYLPRTFHRSLVTVGMRTPHSVGEPPERTGQSNAAQVLGSRTRFAAGVAALKAAGVPAGREL